MQTNIYNRHIVFTSVGTRNYSFYKYIIATVLKRCKLYGQTNYMEMTNTSCLAFLKRYRSQNSAYNTHSSTDNH
jgi:hypothetical protein